MRRTELTEKQLEEILKQMPKIRDNRDSHELYRAISSKMKKKKRPGWIFPSIATAAAFSLLFMLIPNILSWGSPTNLEPINNASTEFAKKEADSSEDSTALDTRQDNTMMAKDSVSEQVIERTAVYQEDLSGKELLMYAIPDQQGQNIATISILVNQDEPKTWAEKFSDNMLKLTESEWGLSDYYPLQGSWTFNLGNKQANLDVPTNHPYGMGSASETSFLSSLQQTFRYTNAIDVITFTTEGTPGIVLGNDELQQLDLTDSKQQKNPYYFLFVEGQNRPLLVPFDNPVESIEEALLVMREGIITHGLQAAIPSDVNFEEISINKKTLTLNFSKDTQLEPTAEMVYMIEAILLVAKDFGYSTVEFSNTDVESIGPFHLKQPIAVPVAPNKHELNQ